MQYAFENRRDKHKFKGETGFNKLKRGEVTYEQIKLNSKNSNKLRVSWKNIDERIKLLPMFLNSLLTKTKLKSTLGINEEPERNTKIKGNYFLYRELHNNSTPIFSLKMVTKNFAVLETFIVDSDKSMTKKLHSIKIESIKLIPPLENEMPMMAREEKCLEKI